MFIVDYFKEKKRNQIVSDSVFNSILLDMSKEQVHKLVNYKYKLFAEEFVYDVETRKRVSYQLYIYDIGSVVFSCLYFKDRVIKKSLIKVKNI